MPTRTARSAFECDEHAERAQLRSAVTAVGTQTTHPCNHCPATCGYGYIKRQCRTLRLFSASINVIMSGRRVVHRCTWVARALAVLLIIPIPLFIEARSSDDTYRKVEGVQEPSLRHFRSPASRPTMPLDEAAADNRGRSNGQRALLSEAQAAPSWGQLPSKGPYTMQHLKMGTRGVFASPGHHTSASRHAWRSLAEKLDNGQGVTIHGIGSSILGNHGGCSEPLPVLKQLCESCCTLVGGDYKPHVDMTGDGCPLCRQPFYFVLTCWFHLLHRCL